MSETNERSVASAGSVGEPVAWAVAGDYGDYAVALFTDKASAQTEADRRALVGLRQGYVVVPLYRSPTLTDAEREAIDTAAHAAVQLYPLTGVGLAAVLRGLLERLGGGR